MVFGLGYEPKINISDTQQREEFFMDSGPKRDSHMDLLRKAHNTQKKLGCCAKSDATSKCTASSIFSFYSLIKY